MRYVNVTYIEYGAMPWNQSPNCTYPDCDIAVVTQLLHGTTSLMD